MKWRHYIAVWATAGIVVIWFYAPEITGLLADRNLIPAHSVASRTLSYGFRPVHVILEAEPFPKIVSREVRHNVFSIVYGREN